MRHARRLATGAGLALLLTGCSNGTTTSTPSTTPPSATATPSTATPSTASVGGSAAFCQAALQWAQSPAAAQAQTAAQSGDADALVDAYKGWAADTQAMADAVPADASPNVKQAFVSLNDSVQTIAREGGQSQKQANAYGAAQGKVLDYYDQTCG